MSSQRRQLKKTEKADIEISRSRYKEIVESRKLRQGKK